MPVPVCSSSRAISTVAGCVRAGRCLPWPTWPLLLLPTAARLSRSLLHQILRFSVPSRPGYLYAEAVEVVNHQKIPCIEVRITNEQGDLVALMTSSGYRKRCELPVDGLE